MVPGQFLARVIASLVFLCLLLCMRTLSAHGQCKAHQTERWFVWGAECSSPPPTCPPPPCGLSSHGSLPGQSSCCADGGGLNWPWVRRELRAPLRALEFRCVHQRGHKVHSRRTSAYREYCGGLAMLELFLSALLVQNGQIPAQHLAKSDAGISSGWISYPWL